MTIDADSLRLLLRDEDENVYTDEQLETYVAVYPDSILRAAAAAIRALAIEYAALGKSTRTEDLALDVRSRGKDLNAVADSFMRDAEAADSILAADFFEVVLPVYTTCVTVPEGTPWPVCCSASGHSFCNCGGLL